MRREPMLDLDAVDLHFADTVFLPVARAANERLGWIILGIVTVMITAVSLVELVR